MKYINQEQVSLDYERDNVVKLFCDVASQHELTDDNLNTLYNEFCDKTKNGVIWSRGSNLVEQQISKNPPISVQCYKAISWDEVVEMCVGKVVDARQSFFDFVRKEIKKREIQKWINGEKKIKHQENESRFLRAYKKLFITEDISFGCETNLTAIRILLENIHYKIHTPGAQHETKAIYFFSTGQGTLKSTIKDGLIEALKEYGIPCEANTFTGNGWIDDKYSRNILITFDDVVFSPKFTENSFNAFAKEMIQNDGEVGTEHPEYLMRQKNVKERMLPLISELLFCGNILPKGNADRRIAPVYFNSIFNFGKTGEFEKYQRFLMPILSKKQLWQEMLETVPFGKVWTPHTKSDANFDNLLTIVKKLSRYEEIAPCSLSALINKYKEYCENNNIKDNITYKREIIEQELNWLRKNKKIKALNRNIGIYTKYDFNSISCLNYYGEGEGNHSTDDDEKISKAIKKLSDMYGFDEDDELVRTIFYHYNAVEKLIPHNDSEEIKLIPALDVGIFPSMYNENKEYADLVTLVRG